MSGQEIHIGIIAPSDKLGKKAASDLKESITLMENWGWNVHYDSELAIRSDGRHKAGTLTERRNEILGYLRMASVGVLATAYGGWGIADLPREIKPGLEKYGVEGKRLVGYSDTCILQAIWVSMGGEAIMAPNISGLATDWDRKTVEMYRRVVETGETAGINEKNANWTPVFPGKCRGRVVPMNLEAFVLSSMTWFAPLRSMDEQVILCLEDTGLLKSELLRWIEVLPNIVNFEKVAGIVFGRINRFKKDDYKRIGRMKVADIVSELADKYIPVAICDGYGHRFNEKEKARFHPLVWGSSAELTVGEGNCSLKFKNKS